MNTFGNIVYVCNHNLLALTNPLLSGESRQHRIRFFDFSSATNTIQPALLCKKLQKTPVAASTTTWIIIDYLTNRLQFVRLKDCLSETVARVPTGDCTHRFSSLSTPQTPVIYRNTPITLQLLGVSVMDKRMSTGQSLCGNNHLILNTNKIKEMNVDFRRTRRKPNTICIQGEEVEVVEDYRYLEVYLAVFKKQHYRLFFSRKLRLPRCCISSTSLWRRVPSALQEGWFCTWDCSGPDCKRTKG